MKKISGLLLLAVFAAVVIAQDPCGVKYNLYTLNNAPATSGLSAGEYEAGKNAYVGLGSYKANALTAGILSTNPAGITLPIVNGGIFVNSTVWFLAPKSTQTFSWVASQNGDSEPFAVDYGTDSSGVPYYFGRVTRNDFVLLGVVRPFMGSMLFLDEFGNLAEISTGYEVLTCQSSVAEDPVTPPVLVIPASNEDTGCIHNWVAYNNDDAPATDGVSAGEYENSKFAYVGKGDVGGLSRPGTIKVGDTAGFWTLDKQSQVYLDSGAFYLANNQSYTYSWKTYTGSLPANAVRVRNNVADLAFGIARQKFNYAARIGMFLGQAAYFTENDGSSTKFDSYFDVLVCDPWPQYECSQTWKPYNNDGAPEVDGLAAGSRNNITSYVGRGSLSCVNCDYNIGRIEIPPASNVGAFYGGDISENEIYDTVNAEYLVKNEGDVYVWKASKDGVLVPNAVGHTPGQNEYYIGMTVVDHQVLIGKVQPDEGLYYSNINGTRTFTNTYAVLTCYSVNPINEV